MIFKKLSLKNFRNINEVKIELSEKVNVIYGENAQGKTNILESLWLFTGAKSFRGSKDTELISFGKEISKISLEFFDGNRENTCVIDIESRRKATLNDVELSSASLLAGKILAVVFSPNDLNIVKDGPIFRRKFLDTALCQLYPLYIDLSRRYLRALDQRNKILKEIKYNPNLEEFLEDFENELSITGSAITKYRIEYVNSLNKYLPEIFNGISGGKEDISLELETECSKIKEEFKITLKNCRKNDIFNQTTSIGPHRDDLNIKINNISARNFGSQGQKRSCALALKLSEAEVINEITGIKPVMLLDDVLSELDKCRQNYILNHIKNSQVFITCCDKSNFEDLKNGKVFYVENGNIF
jgi:DNA replication and repair protein RecF